MEQQVSLYFKSDVSDKEYHAQLVKDDGGYVVNFQYGRRGSTLKDGTKTKEAVDLNEAVKVFERLVKSKVSKGYTEDTSVNPPSVPVGSASNDKVDTGIYPQLLNEIDEGILEEKLNDPSFFAQEKKDGERRLANKGSNAIDFIKGASAIGINKKGQAVNLPKEIAESIKANDLILDAEIVGSQLHVFDIIQHKGKCIRDNSYEKRLEILESLDFGDSVTVIKTARTTKEKKSLLAKLKKENREGIVLKNKHESYKTGRTYSALKFKFYKTATVRVAYHNPQGKSSVGLEMLEGDEVIKVGNVTVAISKDLPPVGSYIEVRYLYAYKGGSLYQPNYLGERNDQDDTDINLSQLVYKAEE